MFCVTKYFYAIYGPGLSFVNSNPALAWLSSVFLPHIVVETASPLLNLHNLFGAVLALLGFVAFGLGAGQVYYHKLARKGAVTGGVYNFIRHPQYASLALCSFGLLLLWPRFIVLLSFITMLFVYYFLARVEERECEVKFGQSYLDYKNKTGMFLPFRLPLLDQLPGLPSAGLKRYLSLLVLYVLLSAAAVGLAIGVRSWALDSIYGFYTQDEAYVSVAEIQEAKLLRIIDIARADPIVQATLGGVSPEKTEPKFINYVLPAQWYVSEALMNVVPGSAGGHFSPDNYNPTLYRVVFTQAELRTGQPAQGRDILLSNPLRRPLIEAVVDLAQNKVVETLLPGETVKYENIPVPVY